ncbi:uncharacterized protein LOC119679331 isoform X2 [Teleopsis dalmanni]|uniref:uncharacterized protein LOC119679331 isoform X2 n=1 Tax=Teleopsis dalmanni TaxID=139649 RepID=UPI0018CDB7F2|nr:uncharacterized protein LOC119679331 isoform X2 [Teleopsis dalmanni]
MIVLTVFIIPFDYNESGCRAISQIGSSYKMDHLWKRELVMALIKEWRQHDNLYNISNHNYTRKYIRNRSIKAIYNVLKKSQAKITIEMIKKKMHTLRTQFCKERKLYIDFKSRNTSYEEYEPKLWCYDYLTFLKPFACDTAKASNFIADDHSMFEYESSDASQPSNEIVKSTNDMPTDTEANYQDDNDYQSEKAEPSFKSKSLTAPKKTSNCINKPQPKVNYNSIATTIQKIKTELLHLADDKYTWLGEHVVNEICKIEDESILEDCISNIQLILKNSLAKSKEVTEEIDPFGNDMK